MKEAKTEITNTINIYLKIFYIISLLIIITSCSIIIITDSKNLYDLSFGKAHSWKSWLQASVLEIIVIVYANMQIGSKKFRFFAASLAFFALTGLIISSSIQIVTPIMKILENDKKIEFRNEETKKENELIKRQNDLKNKQLEALLKMSENYMQTINDAAKFSQETDQKANAAINTRRSAYAFNKVSKLVEQSIKNNSKKIETKKLEETKVIKFLGINISIINIFILLFLRIILQLGSFGCSKALGIVWKTPIKRKIEEVKKETFEEVNKEVNKEVIQEEELEVKKKVKEEVIQEEKLIEPEIKNSLQRIIDDSKYIESSLSEQISTKLIKTDQKNNLKIKNEEILFEANRVGDNKKEIKIKSDIDLSEKQRMKGTLNNFLRTYDQIVKKKFNGADYYHKDGKYYIKDKNGNVLSGERRYKDINDAWYAAFENSFFSDKKHKTKDF